MASEAFVGGYFWGVYVWFVLGVLLIGIPAICEIARVIRNK
jgi:hypothetical protein